MPVTRYGIFLDWGPLQDLRGEGLGRQLAAFLKGATERPDVRFVLACPSWGRLQLQRLCTAEGVPLEQFELLSLEKPISLRLYDALLARRARPSRIKRQALLVQLRRAMQKIAGQMERHLVSTRQPLMLALLALLMSLGFVLLVAAKLLSRTWLKFWRTVGRAAHHIDASLPVAGRRGRSRVNSQLFERWYGLLKDSEAELLVQLINRRTDIVAWYCPTAFWEHFNRIHAPRLMCVPDLVVGDFPVGFDRIGGQPLLVDFNKLRRTVQAAGQLVTYSDHTRRAVIESVAGIEFEAVHVVPHAPQNLLPWINVSGTADDKLATLNFCRQQFGSAIRTASNRRYAETFANPDVQFIFYASQFRPNKNVISLLRAYLHLLRKRYAGVKLVLTGDPEDVEIAAFVRAERLSQDVLFFNRIPVRQLAACYRLARLAVNPSLSEGGFPFTFAEALSVGTPVVMSRIGVAEEVITDPALAEAMLFDPHDWRDIANRIEWALHNPAPLLALQQPLYQKLSKRSWRQVVDEHIVILDGLAGERTGKQRQ